MLDDLRRVTTGSFPEELRAQAWAAVLQRVLLSADIAPSFLTPSGSVSSRRSSLDSVFARVQSSPQVLLPHPANATRYGGTVLVVALLEGSGLVVEGEESIALSAGDVLLLDPTKQWRIEMCTDYRAMFVKLEAASFVLRLVRTSGQDLNKISSLAGVGAICLNLVRSIADQLDDLGAHELLPMESTLTELLVTCLSQVEGAGVEDTTSVQLGHLRRLCRTIEAKLGDAEFTIDDIGRLEMLSTRYIQKLFKTSGTTFGDYVKTRRLERCRTDLSIRALAHFLSQNCASDGALATRPISAVLSLLVLECLQRLGAQLRRKKLTYLCSVADPWTTMARLRVELSPGLWGRTRLWARRPMYREAANSRTY